jgi:hypothetical protein
VPLVRHLINSFVRPADAGLTDSGHYQEGPPSNRYGECFHAGTAVIAGAA